MLKNAMPKLQQLKNNNVLSVIEKSFIRQKAKDQEYNREIKDKVTKPFILFKQKGVRYDDTQCRHSYQPCSFYGFISEDSHKYGYNKIKRNSDPVTTNIYITHGYI